MERRLAAILSADVVGYSRLMEQDEAGTFARLRAHRKELLEPQIAAHHGRIFKLMGDGLLAEFASVVDAVECAVVLQEGMAQRNANATPEHRIEARMGVNLGDVIIETGEDGATDMHGEGVIIASRLQALAEPGGICVAQTVVSHVGNKIPVNFESFGEHRVKNIAEPVRVYRALTGRPVAPRRSLGLRGASRQRWRWPAAAVVALLVVLATIVALWLRPWSPAQQSAAVEAEALPLPDKPSLAVLPFANLSNDPQQTYFADGMAEDLMTGLSHVTGLFVIARHSAFTYKDQELDLRKVGRELGVRYIVEGSVQRTGDHVRINIQLVDTSTLGHLWAEKYDGSMVDIFALQDRVSKSVVDALALKLTVGEQQALVAQKETAVPEAYDEFLQGGSALPYEEDHESDHRPHARRQEGDGAVTGVRRLGTAGLASASEWSSPVAVFERSGRFQALVVHFLAGSDASRSGANARVAMCRSGAWSRKHRIGASDAPDANRSGADLSQLCTDLVHSLESTRSAHVAPRSWSAAPDNCPCRGQHSACSGISSVKTRADRN